MIVRQTGFGVFLLLDLVFCRGKAFCPLEEVAWDAVRIRAKFGKFIPGNVLFSSDKNIRDINLMTYWHIVCMMR